MKGSSNDAWVFISHSNADIQSLRRIRNRFETSSANPILFFLKQEVEDELLWQLLQREIEARRFFALCDSQAACESKYVRREMDLVRSLPKKRITTIDLALPESEQDAVIDRLIRDLTVFCSYARQNRDAVGAYAAALKGEDFRVWTDALVLPSVDWRTQLSGAIQATVASGGFFLLFASPASLASRYVEAETHQFMQLPAATASGTSRKQMVIVLLDGAEVRDLPVSLRNRQIVDLERAYEVRTQIPDIVYAFRPPTSDHRANAQRLADLLAAMPSPP
jgi:TIR domain